MDFQNDHVSGLKSKTYGSRSIDASRAAAHERCLEGLTGHVQGTVRLALCAVLGRPRPVATFVSGELCEANVVQACTAIAAYLR